MSRQDSNPNRTSLAGGQKYGSGGSGLQAPNSVESAVNRGRSIRDSALCHSVITMTPFSGNNDFVEAADWIDLFDSISTDYGWSDSRKLIRVGGHLQMHALMWYCQTIKSINVAQANVWQVFKTLFAKRFATALSTSPSTRSSVSSNAGPTSSFGSSI